MVLHNVAVESLLCRIAHLTGCPADQTLGTCIFMGQMFPAAGAVPRREQQPAAALRCAACRHVCGHRNAERCNKTTERIVTAQWYKPCIRPAEGSLEHNSCAAGKAAQGDACLPTSFQFRLFTACDMDLYQSAIGSWQPCAAASMHRSSAWRPCHMYIGRRRALPLRVNTFTSAHSLLKFSSCALLLI